MDNQGNVIYDNKNVGEINVNSKNHITNHITNNNELFPKISFSFKRLKHFYTWFRTERKAFPPTFQKDNDTDIKFFIPTYLDEIIVSKNEQGVSSYYPQRIKKKNQDPKSKDIESIEYFLKEFESENSARKRYLVLASTGMGKTAFLKNLFLKWKSNYFRYSKKNIKIFSLAGNINELDIIDFLANENKGEDAKNTILLLDALDENLEAVHEQYGSKNTKQKEVGKPFQIRLEEATNRFYKVVVTARRQFFVNQDGEWNKEKIKGLDNQNFKDYSKIEICRFDEKKREKFLNKKYGRFGRDNDIDAFINEKINQNAKDIYSPWTRPLILSLLDTLFNPSISGIKISIDIYKKFKEEQSRDPSVENVGIKSLIYSGNHPKLEFEVSKLKEELDKLQEGCSGRVINFLKTNKILKYKYIHQVYEKFIHEWILREMKKLEEKGNLPEENSSAFIKESKEFINDLAQKSIDEDDKETTLTNEKVIEILKHRKFKVIKKEIAFVDTILIRTHGDNWRFAHRSFLEVILARLWFKKYEFEKVELYASQFSEIPTFIEEICQEEYIDPLLPEVSSNNRLHQDKITIDYKDFNIRMLYPMNNLKELEIINGDINLNKNLDFSDEWCEMNSEQFGKIKEELKLQGFTKEIITAIDIERKNRIIHNTFKVTFPTGTGYKFFREIKEGNFHGKKLTSIKFLEGWSGLESLDLSDNPEIEIKDYSIIGTLTNLKRLNLSNNHLNENNIQFLKNLTQLEQLILDGNKIKDFSLLKNLENLKRLSVKANQIQNISFLKHLTNLTHLDLRDNQIKLEDLKHAIKDLKNLTHLQIEGNEIKNAELAVLKEHRDKQWVSLSGNADYTVPLGNTEIEFVKIPRGKFTMGSMEDTDENPIIEDLKIEKEFYMAKYPVTLEVFREYFDMRKKNDVEFSTISEKSIKINEINYTGIPFKIGTNKNKYFKENNWKKPFDDHDQSIQEPVVGINYYDAIEFCNYLNVNADYVKKRDNVYEWKKTFLSPEFMKEIGRIRKSILEFLNDTEILDRVTDEILVKIKYEQNRFQLPNGLRLPFEYEWEYAARGSASLANATDRTATKYYWGDEENGEYFWYSENSEGKTHPVGEKLPNAFGLYDMSGNVWEWCEDYYDEKKYSKISKAEIYEKKLEQFLRNDLNEVKDNSDFFNKNGITRVLRGGSWNSVAFDCRSSGRGRSFPASASDLSGFRLVAPLGAFQ